MTTINIPASLDEAVNQLTGLGELLTATEWERAAIVAAFVRLPGAGARTDLATSSQVRSPNEFANLGITGLKSKDTVRRYVQAWLYEHDGKYPKPGAKRVIPTKDFPTHPGNTGTRATPSNVAEQLKDPEFRERVVRMVDQSTLDEIVVEATEVIEERAEVRPRPIPIPADDMLNDPRKEVAANIASAARHMLAALRDDLADAILADDDNLVELVLEACDLGRRMCGAMAPDTIEELLS